MSGGQDFSEDITNGGFASDEVELHHNEGDEDMVMGADGDLAMNQDDSMQGASGSENTGANGEGHGDDGKDSNQEMESADNQGSGSGSGNADQ